jgi:ribosome-binding factor A
MLEGKRQKQVASLLSKELSDILNRKGLTMFDGGMVSIASVKITPDLFDARVYLSFFKMPDTTLALKKIEENAHDIKRELTTRIRHQMRSMPKITYFIDDTLDYVDKIEDLFKEIKKDDENIKRL